MFILAELRRNETNLIHVHTKVEQISICHSVALDPRGRDFTVSTESTRLKIDCLIRILRNDRYPTFFKKDTNQKGGD